MCFVSFLLELPSLLPIVDVAEALLHVRNGDWFLCLLVANVPDSFNEGNSSAPTTLCMLSSDNLRQSGWLTGSIAPYIVDKWYLLWQK